MNSDNFENQLPNYINQLPLTLLDKSNYLKGLLVLAKQDKVLEPQEKHVIRDIARSIGFGEDFYEEALRGLMVNKYITEDPIVFSSREVAEAFIKDGLQLASADNRIDAKEMQWLEKTAAANNINSENLQVLVENNRQG